MRKYLITFGVLELVFPSLALYMLLPLIDLQKRLGVNSAAPILGVLFFALVIVWALVQIAAGAFSLDLKLGMQKTKYLMILGGIFTLLTIPAILFFVVRSIYSTIAILK